ncbi:hypothetical protein E5163_08960 [Marinicauda algicola]|uniref:Acylase n=1 Tax=Marinicauda algicola TaxID=2029849 RepID=A0A4S2H1Q8_9PROT|nr:penicillin acylase family protein [Marinicauda algicola]TGY89238.1 hypothetical protein E5163_08960 [Marinicauda algicola]
MRTSHIITLAAGGLLVGGIGAAFALGLRLAPLEGRSFDRDAAVAAAGAYSAEIARDAWGVPRVIGETDADAAFGLAFAHAEDDFETIQGSLRAGLGAHMLARNEEEAKTSYLVQLLKIREDVAERYETDLSPGTRAFAEGYAAGLNLYAARHPHEIVERDLFPVTGEDVIALSAFFSPLFYGFGEAVGGIMAPEVERDPSRGQELQVYLQDGPDTELGSNAIAVAPHRSADGATRLVVNSHQPTEGALAWYEAQVVSDEGLNFAGGLFPGSPALHLGTNPDLGFAATVNYPDLIDVYRLELTGDGEAYVLDGEARAFERATATMTVRLWGPFAWRVTRPLEWSVHGPVFRTAHGTYALRYATMGDIRFGEQAYRMMRARSVAEFEAALEMGAMGNTNRIAADREGRIARYYLARMPDRPAVPGLDWRGILPGDRSDLVWQDFAPLSALPHMVDPAAGYVLESNHSPFAVTLTQEDPDAEDYPPQFGIETVMTNRALRATGLFADDGDGLTSREELLGVKYDDRYDRESEAAALRQAILDHPWSDPLHQEAARIAAGWDLGAQAENRGAAIVLLCWYLKEGDVLEDVPNSLPRAAEWLMTHHGRLDPEWGEVNRLVRGEVSLPLDGGPDTLRAVYGRPAEDGTLHMVAGDGLTMVVEWSDSGEQSVFAVHQYGSSNRPGTGHFTSQMQMFAEEDFRPVPMSEAGIRAAAVRVYRPGE